MTLFAKRLGGERPIATSYLQDRQPANGGKTFAILAASPTRSGTAGLTDRVSEYAGKRETTPKDAGSVRARVRRLQMTF